MRSTIETARLSLCPLTVDVIDALLTDNAEAFHKATGGTYPPGSPIPPLMEDAFPYIRSWILEHREDDAWSWVGIDRDRGEAVVFGGLGLGLDDRGVATMGYSVYPRDEGRQYASEFAKALVEWVFREVADCVAVEATIPPGHGASIRVAEKCGMAAVGTATDPEVGEVLVYRLDRA